MYYRNVLNLWRSAYVFPDNNYISYNFNCYALTTIFFMLPTFTMCIRNTLVCCIFYFNPPRPPPPPSQHRPLPLSPPSSYHAMLYVCSGFCFTFLIASSAFGNVWSVYQVIFSVYIILVHIKSSRYAMFIAHYS